MSKHTNSYPIEAMKQHITLVREAKAKMVREIEAQGFVSLRTMETYEVAIMAFSGDRMLSSIEQLIDQKEDVEITGRINLLTAKFLKGA